MQRAAACGCKHRAFIPAGQRIARERCARRSYQYFVMAIFEMAWTPNYTPDWWQQHVTVCDPYNQLSAENALAPH